VLAIALTDDGAHVRVWSRTCDGTRVDVVPFEPFVLVGDPAQLDGAARPTWIEKLDGPGTLSWRATFATWADARAARERCGTQPFLFLSDPGHQYLLQSGRTSFHGMTFRDLRRLVLDIEVSTTAGYEFPNAARPDDRVIAVALVDSAGYEEVLRGDDLDEPALLTALNDRIRERDPDVIEGHNIFRFDLVYLETRARRYGMRLAWGRDGGVLRGRTRRLAIAERSISYCRYEVPGRHIADTWILAQLHDVGSRDLPGFGLKDLARHFGVAAGDRTYVPGDAITDVFRRAPDQLMAYALDDARETLALGALFSPPFFAQAQLLPFDYQSVMLRGAAEKIDALLMREYLRRHAAIPVPGTPAAVGGAHVAVYAQGVARPVLHVDVTSLYPSLMLARGIAPASDALGVFLPLLADLRYMRLEARRRAREAPDAAHYRALQQSFKTLINAFYGYLAYSRAHWNDYAAADRITAEGRALVTALVERLHALGATPIEADTDGVYFVPPRGHRAEADDLLLQQVAAALPPGIQLELDGRYAAMFSYKPKTYALLDATGGMTMRGSAFRSRALEPFQRRLIEDLVRLAMTGRGSDGKAVVQGWLEDFRAHRVPPKLFSRTETLQETLDAYRERVAAGLRPASPAYEVALGSGRGWEPGDQVSWYVAGRRARGAVIEHARLATSWDRTRPDENVEYYQQRVLDVWTRLRRLVEHDGLQPVIDEPAEQAQLPLF
jgi:DNA polymerase elongation subunit (family B)